MARKSRKTAAAPEQPRQSELKSWRAALYIRLSVEFNGKRGDSLETQRQIMEAFLALCPDIEIAAVYTDNGVSGQTFERTAFRQMLEDVEAGKINCIVVKDLSRLGRSTIDTGYYLEKYFPLHHVRFIAVNDQYDSEDTENSTNSVTIALKNMINEAYAADISKKVRAQQRQAMRGGEYIGARPPYGYRKDPENCHRLLVDDETAPVVRELFQWAAAGVPLNAMVKRLNEGNILTPGYHLSSIGLSSNKRLMGSGKWQTRTVGKILADQVYTGDLVQGKTKTSGRKQTAADPANWITVRGTHEALVTREVFEQAQAARTKAAARYTQTEKIAYTPNILRSRIFCGHCGKSLHRQRSRSCYFYRCITNDRTAAGTCPGDIRYFKEDDLFHVILTIIRQKAENMLGDRLRLKQCDRKILEQRAAVDREIAQLRQETEKNRALLTSLYENFVTGILTRAEYQELKEDYSKKISRATERVGQLLEQQNTLEKQAERYTCMADRLAAVEEDTVLTAQLVDQLIERVTVNGPDDISIRFCFESGFEALMGVLDSE